MAITSIPVILAGGKTITFKHSHTVKVQVKAPTYKVIEEHKDSDGNTWYMIEVYNQDIVNWLAYQAEITPEKCGEGPGSWAALPVYNVDQGLFAYMELKWK